MAAGMFEELDDLTTCSICSESFTKRKPRQLDCLHYFCEECISALLNNTSMGNPHAILCPECKQKTVVPGGSAAKLPLHFVISRVQNLTKQLEQRHSICRRCKSETHKAEISFYCIKCALGLCECCHADHQRFYQNHTQIPASPSVINNLICTEHDVYHAHFCITCGKAICSHCRIGEHSEHKVYDIRYEDKETEQDIKNILLSSLHSVIQSLDNLPELKVKVDKDVENIMIEMTHHRDRLIKEINEQFDALRKELEQKHEEINTALLISNNLAEEAFHKLQELLIMTDSLEEPIEGIPEARIDQAQLMEDFRCQITYDGVNAPLKTVNFVSGNDHVRLGKIVEKPLGFSVVRPLETLTEEMCQILEAASIRPVLLWEKNVNIVDMDYLQSGQLVVSTSDSICLYDENGSRIPHYLNDFSIGQQICAVSASRKSNKIAALQNRGWRSSYLHIFKEDDDKWLHNKYEVCTEPAFVGMMNSGGFVVYSSEDCKLHLYDPRGKEFTCSLPMLTDVFDVFVDDDDQIFVCCKFDVHVYGKTGHKVSSLSTKNIKLQPLSVHVETNGEIFVADDGHRSVLLFDRNYDFVRSLIDFNFSPNKIALHQRKRLSVYGSGKLCAYKL